MKKKLLCLLLALVMTVGLLPLSALAAEDVNDASEPVAQAAEETEEQPTEAAPEEEQTVEAPKVEAEAENEPAAQADDAEYKIYVTSNVWDRNVEVVSSPASVKGGETVAFNYESGSLLTIKPTQSINVVDTTCDLIAISLNGVRYEKPTTTIKFQEGGLDGFTAKATITKDLKLTFAKNGSLTDDIHVEYIYDNIPTNTEDPLFTPVVTSANVKCGTIGQNALEFVQNYNGTSIWSVVTTPADWYKLDYIEDNAGNKFQSLNGTTVDITATEDKQAFTAYFTVAVDPMYDETPAKSVDINMTVSNDGIPLLAADGETILSHKDITVPYFDLANYGLDRFYRYGTEYGWGAYNDETVIERPTALHAYIYIIERYYMGLPESECGTGESGILDYNKNTDVKYMDGTDAYSSGRTAALLPTGTATSLYMKYFWGHDENLMYFRNHEYPLMSKGWGSTCDYILLSDGDVLDVAMFSNWDFYKDGGFNQFSQDAYIVAAGETVTTSTFKAGTNAAEDGESPALEPISGLDVAVYDENWDKIADVTGDGTYSYTFDKAGTYYFMATDTGAKTNNAHYAPATAKVTVLGTDDSGAYTLNTVADMLWFQQYVNEKGHTDAKAVLGGDVNMTNVRWNGIKGFTGTFDGAGHTLTVVLTNTGLFNDLAGTVKNLTVEGTITAGGNIGAIASVVNDGTVVIENCVNKANITNNVSGNVGHTGGIVGRLKTSASVINCRNYGAITVKSGYPGGILGCDESGGSANITRCENHGTIKNNGAYASGGIVGYCQNGMTISKCLNTGEVIGGLYAGGILGRNEYYTGLIEQCVNSGNIIAQNEDASINSMAGGIVAFNGAEINSCYNTGAVTGRTAGGISGENRLIQIRNTWSYAVGKVSNCYTTGIVTGNSDDAVVGAAVGKLHIGGDPSQTNTYRDFQVYALEGTCENLVGEKAEKAQDLTSFVTSEELKSDEMLEKLGENFKKTYISNNGYPLLTWQSEDPITGLVKIDGQIMYYTNGEFDATKKGVARMADGSDSNWYYVENGVFKEATGIAQRADGSNNNWYYVQNGIYKKATGIARYADGSSKNWYYVEKGQYKKATGIARYADGSSKDWYYVQNGKYIKATGIAQYADGSSNNWYFVKNGKYTKTTGLTQKADGSSKNWYYVSGGRYRTDYTGLAPRIPDGKLFYVKNGVYRNNFNGTVKYQGKTYTVKNGRAV